MVTSQPKETNFSSCVKTPLSGFTNAHSLRTLRIFGKFQILKVMKFSKELKSEKDRLGLTLVGLASALDVGQRTVEHWLKNDRTPAMVTQEGVLSRLKGLKENS
jgi:DNA-binding transcriptional regulator YiaG